MNSVVPRVIPGYRHNLISDLVTMNVWALLLLEGGSTGAFLLLGVKVHVRRDQGLFH